MGQLEEVDSEKSLPCFFMAQLYLSGSIKAILSKSTQKVLFFSFFPSQFASLFFFDSNKCAWGLNKDKYKLQK